MLIISNNLIGKMPIDNDAVIRINLAWIKNIDEAKEIIKNCKHDIYLDYPTGRTKPPKPTIKISEAIRLTKNKNVKYFAVSNVESADFCERIMHVIGEDVEFIPKIETISGVLNLHEMIKSGIKTIMLDKEDLYTSAKQDAKLYRELINLARSHKVKILELTGVVFK